MRKVDRGWAIRVSGEPPWFVGRFLGQRIGVDDIPVTLTGYKKAVFGTRDEARTFSRIHKEKLTGRRWGGNRSSRVVCVKVTVEVA